ncbi:MAG TPA: histone deacetylase [Gemmatimonas aurantiaca]|uniref:Histone deacetylase n=1 Tax=Gemmatimonas aurantiaca TaxID=173480 RepID=A0A3D4V9K9_9BACT|nr:histone deacetylase [Gemmatimonas aurantiaca]
MHLWSSASYAIDLPEGHRFPMDKYRLLREAVLAEGLVAPDRVHDPQRALEEDLRRVHTVDYVAQIRDGTLPAAEQRRIGLPWSPSFVERAFRVVQGTIEASACALREGLAMNLAGGTHHAFPDRGEGFCTFNDVAVAVRRLQAEGAVQRVAIVDLDVHQGNGTHGCFAGDEQVFTFSMHGAKNFPFHKVPGTLDVELEDGTGDEAYLALLQTHLPRVLRISRPDLVVYLAGADPHEGDRLGRLALTFDGLMTRDRYVIASCREVGIPVCVTMSGGYGRNIDDTVAVHVNTVRVLSAYADEPFAGSRGLLA